MQLQITEDLDRWEGTVEHITFKNEESGFAIMKLCNEERQLETVVGMLASVQVGELVCCWGKWKMDKRYGKQLDVQWFETKIPTSLLGVERFLGSGLVKGIGPTLAKRIVRQFGVNALDVLDGEPHRLREVPGIGKKTLEKIVVGWKQQHNMRRVMIWLQNFGVSPAFAQRIYKEYGEQSLDKIQENPYRMADEVIGIGFKTADQIAQKMGVPLHSPQRLQAAIEYQISEQLQQGHTCYPLQLLIDEVRTLVAADEDRVREGIADLSHQKKVIIQSLLTDKGLESFVWNALYYYMEQRIANVMDMLTSEENTNEIQPKEEELNEIRAIAQTMGIGLEKQQESAVWRSTHQKAHIITGGPGTGKSTIIKVLVKWLQTKEQTFILAAPTGRAAKRLGEVTGQEASTLHSLLGYAAFANPRSMGQASNNLRADVVVVDEASMVDTVLMNALLRALSEGTRLVLVGDIDQLPSVGAGNVLRDMIASGRIPMTRLTEIFRQAQSSHIIINAHRINKGEPLSTRIDRNSDFFFLQEELPEGIQKMLLSLLSGRLQKTYQWDMLRDVQVLSPMNKGELGTVRLNELIQQTLNPPNTGKPQLERGKTIFVEGDKVLQTRNNYEKGVYNGDIGYIESIDTEEKLLLVRVDGNVVEYSTDDWMELELAYAISVHKYQGSECPCVLIPLHISHYKLLTRNLLYTAVTRGKKLVIVVGSERAMQQAIESQADLHRYTGLQQALSRHNTLGFPPIVIVPLPPPGVSYVF